MYVDILKVLDSRGPLELAHIMCNADVNCEVLNGYLGFLLAQGLVEQRLVGDSGAVYANTPKGLSVLKFF
jgi:predicted transcriptional regulator